MSDNKLKPEQVKVEKKIIKFQEAKESMERDKRKKMLEHFYALSDHLD